MEKYTGRSESFFDGFERGMGIIRRHGWAEARDMFNEQYPHDWKPTSPEAWQHSKGYLEALTSTQ